MTDQAFGLEIERYRAKLISFASRSCTLDDAHDLAQDAILRAWSHRDRYRAECGAIGTWLFGILIKAIIQSKRGPRARIATYSSEWWAGLVSENSSHDDLVHQLSLDDHLAGLNPDETVIVRLLAAGYDYPSISEATGMKLGSIKHHGGQAAKILAKRVR